MNLFPSRIISKAWFRWVFIIFVCLTSLAPSGNADIDDVITCVRRAARVVMTELKYYSPITWYELFKYRGEKHGMPVTRRGAAQYIWNLHLMDYDFKGKAILDVGAGGSQFVPYLNTEYYNTGTRAVAVDYSAKRGFKNDIYVRADAQKLPFADNTFDLTTSIWFLNNLARPSLPLDLPTAKNIAAREEMLVILRNSVNEMIRVTKPGGEIRVARTLFDKLKSDIMPQLEGNPKVDYIETFFPGLKNGYILIKIKDAEAPKTAK